MDPTTPGLATGAGTPGETRARTRWANASWETRQFAARQATKTNERTMIATLPRFRDCCRKRRLRCRRDPRCSGRFASSRRNQLSLGSGKTTSVAALHARLAKDFAQGREGDFAE